MAEYNPEHPPITLYGSIGNINNKDLYGVNDETGLGPNGSDKYISFDIVISGITSQNVGDASIRESNGLAVGGSYTGQDLKVGDWVRDGLKVWKITDITAKTDSYISCSIEDVGMTIARQRSDRANNPSNGDLAVVFEVNDNEIPLFASNQTNNLTTNNAIDIIQYI